MSTLKKLVPATVAAATVLLSPVLAFAADSAVAGASGDNVKSWAAIGAGIAIGAAAIGGTLGQGRAAAAALEGISRNPGAAARIQTPMILGLALIESLVLFGFVVAYLLTGIAGK